MSSVLTTMIVGLWFGPLGFYQMCDRDPAQCEVVVGTVDPSIETVARVNVYVNHHITPKPEVGDDWRVNVSSGDCEDYALTKRDMLIRRGVPSSKLRMATGWTTDRGEYHAVLVVSIRQGDFVLDNRTDELLPVGHARIKLVSIQSMYNPKVWLKVMEN